MGSLTQDLRCAFCMVFKKPVFTAIVMVTPALGIGAYTAVFCTVNGLLLHPLPIEETDHLVSIHETNVVLGEHIVACGKVDPTVALRCE